MKITFLGANHEVTGSCTLIEAAGQRGVQRLQPRALVAACGFARAHAAEGGGGEPAESVITS